jgi:hypothetical protein
MPCRAASIRGQIGFVVALLLGTTAPAVYAQDVEPAAVESAAVPAVDAPPASRIPFRQRLIEWRGEFAEWRTGAGVMFPLYAGFGGLQVLDIHSTTRAIDAGSVEKNGMMSGVAGHPAALMLVKGGATAATIYLVETKLRKPRRAAAIAAMVGVNSAYVLIVAHNYRAAH